MNTHDPDKLSWLRRLYAEGNRAYAFRGGSRRDFELWAESARPALRDLIGLQQLKAGLRGFTPSVSLGDPEVGDGYTRQKCVLCAEPDFAVPFWYLKPHGSGPHPLALFPHGHYSEHGLDYAVGIAASPEMQARIEAQDRDVAVQAVRQGFAAIAPATRGFPPVAITDISSRHDGRACRSHLMHSLLAGRTVIGERVWDLQCLLDWGLDQADIDGSRVLMMGNSGGGVATLYAAACDLRVTVAVSSCAFQTFVGHNGVIHHCDCNMVPGIMRFGEFHDVAGLIAPRSLLIVHGRHDSLFTNPEIDRAMAGLQRVYQAAEAPSAVRHRWGPRGHQFYRDLMWPFIMDAIS